MQKLIAVLAISTILGFAGCTTRFTSDFEDGTAGTSPSVRPAGTPNDMVQVLPPPGAILVSASNPLSGAQSLDIKGPVSRSTRPTTYMYAETLRNRQQPVFAQWQGRLESNASTSIEFFTGHFSAMVLVELEQGNVIVNNERIGRYEVGQEHFIFLRATPADDTFGFLMLSDGKTIETTGTVRNNTTFPQSNIGLVMALTGGGSAASYKVDNVRMSERNPPRR